MPTMKDVYIAIARFEHSPNPLTLAPGFQQEYKLRISRFLDMLRQEQGDTLAQESHLPPETSLGRVSSQAFHELRELMTPGTVAWNAFAKPVAA